MPPPSRSTLDGFDLPAGTLLGGDFRIDARIGAGGVGVVYRGWQYSMGQPVAVKVLGAVAPSGEQLLRFAREARAVGAVRHPGVVELIHVGRDRGLNFLVLELVDGQTVRDWLATAAGTPTPVLPETLVLWGAEAPTVLPPPPPPEVARLHTDAHVRRAAEIVRDAARAVGAAHAQGVVHRDLKPDNLMLTADGRVKVIDFGLSRAFADATLTATGALIGTPVYMAPEQLAGRSPGPAADVWALGAVLYELLAGSPPAAAGSYEAVLRNVLYRPPVPIDRANPAVDRRLAAAVHAALCRDEHGRYATADGFAADLDNWLAGGRVSASNYRYRFDRREVVAERPRRVAAAGIPMVAMGGVFLMTAVAAVPEWALGAWCLVFAGVLLAGGVGVLRGRKGVGWAAAGVVLAAAVYMSVAVAGRAVRFDGVAAALVGLAGAMWGIGLMLVWALASGPGRRWFRFAAARRAEFRAAGSPGRTHAGAGSDAPAPAAGSARLTR